MFDIYALDDHFLAREVDNQGVFAYRHSAKYEVSQVVYYGLTHRCCDFSIPHVTRKRCRLNFCFRSLEGVYALGAIYAGEDAEQHICAAAGPGEVQ